MGLVDIESLALQCHDEEAKDLIREAVDAYKAGAYRSAIVSSWLAVYFDLTSKLKSLALAGNEEASNWISAYDNYLDNYDPEKHNTVVPLLRLESEILNKAESSSIGLLSRIELFDLKRLKADRNRCAHPTMRNKHDRFNPSAELARTHLRNAVEHVLSRPAIHGQLAVERLLALCCDEGFPTASHEAVEILRGSDIKGIDERSLPAVIASLLNDIFDDQTTALIRSQRLAALEAVRDILRFTFDQQFTNCFSDLEKDVEERDLIIVIGLARRARWFWPLLTPLHRSFYKDQVRNATVDDGNGRFVVIEALGVSELRDVAREKLQDFSHSDLAGSDVKIGSDVVLDEAVRRLFRSNSWNETYTIVGTLIRPNITDVTSTHVRSILEAYEVNSDVRGSVSMLPLLQSILETCSEEVLGSKNQWEWTASAASESVNESAAKFMMAFEDQFGEMGSST